MPKRLVKMLAKLNGPTPEYNSHFENHFHYTWKLDLNVHII